MNPGLGLDDERVWPKTDVYAPTYQSRLASGTARDWNEGCMQVILRKKSLLVCYQKWRATEKASIACDIDI
jgi:hypothetical protein